MLSEKFNIGLCDIGGLVGYFRLVVWEDLSKMTFELKTLLKIVLPPWEVERISLSLGKGTKAQGRKGREPMLVNRWLGTG